MNLKGFQWKDGIRLYVVTDWDIWENQLSTCSVAVYDEDFNFIHNLYWVSKAYVLLTLVKNCGSILEQALPIVKEYSLTSTCTEEIEHMIAYINGEK